MSLGENQKQRILYHLCYPGLTIVSGSTNYNSVINDRLTDITSDIQDIVEEILECLEEAETELKNAKKCLKLAKVDDVTINTDHLSNLKYEYRRLQKKLSYTLDIPVYCGGNSVRICV